MDDGTVISSMEMRGSDKISGFLVPLLSGLLALIYFAWCTTREVLKFIEGWVSLSLMVL